jgi:hypothetical protein
MKKNNWSIWNEILYWLVFVFSWIYIFVFLYPVSFIANVYWLVKIIYNKKLKSTLAEMRAEAVKIKTFAKVEKLYTRFNYQFDGIADWPGILGKWPTWVPLIVVFFYRKKKDNCDGAEKYARWLIKHLNKNKGKKVTAKKQIYVPLLNLKKVHYFTVVNDPEAWTNRLVFSDGVVWRASAEVFLRMANGYEKRVELYPGRN